MRSLRRSVPAFTAIAVGAALASATATPAGAQTADRPQIQGRYAMTPVDGGFLRLDTDTGMVALCAKKGADWLCEAVKDDAQAMRRDLDRLAQENKDLRRELDELRRLEGAGAPPGGPRAERKLELPTEEEIDKALSYLDRMLKKFKGFIEKQAGQEAPGKPL